MSDSRSLTWQIWGSWAWAWATFLGDDTFCTSFSCSLLHNFAVTIASCKTIIIIVVSNVQFVNKTSALINSIWSSQGTYMWSRLAFPIKCCNRTAWPSAGPEALFPLCLCEQFQVWLPGLWEAKHTTLLQCCPVGVVSAFHSSSWIFSFAPMGSGNVILCTDHPILGQAVIVLHLDYPNCYESQDAFSSGHVECTSLPHRSDVFEFWPYF